MKFGVTKSLTRYRDLSIWAENLGGVLAAGVINDLAYKVQLVFPFCVHRWMMVIGPCKT